VGTHLPYCNDTTAVAIVNQMNTTTYFHGPPMFPKNSSIAASVTIVSTPSTQIGRARARVGDPVVDYSPP
jgi:hypothetical protein